MVIRFKHGLAAAALLAGGLVLAPIHALAANERGSEADAKTMARQAALAKSAGPEKAFKVASSGLGGTTSHAAGTPRNLNLALQAEAMTANGLTPAQIARELRTSVEGIRQAIR